MPRATVMTPLRDAAPLLAAYRDRIFALEHVPLDLRVVCVEGDSLDDTWPMLQMWAKKDYRVLPVKCDTGAPRYPSIVDAARFKVLARVFNAGLDAVDLAWSEYVLVLPCDIRYRPDLLTRLLAHDKDLVVPFVYMHGRFYDVWAFQRAGHPFGPFPEEMAAVLYGHAPIPMDSIGGTLLMRAAVLRAGCRYTEEEVDRGLCRMARARGFSLWADPATAVYHDARTYQGGPRRSQREEVPCPIA